MCWTKLLLEEPWGRAFLMLLAETQDRMLQPWIGGKTWAHPCSRSWIPQKSEPEGTLLQNKTWKTKDTHLRKGVRDILPWSRNIRNKFFLIFKKILLSHGSLGPVCTGVWSVTRQSGRLLSKSLQAINAGEGMEKREPSYTVGGNAN